MCLCKFTNVNIANTTCVCSEHGGLTFCGRTNPHFMVVNNWQQGVVLDEEGQQSILVLAHLVHL